MRLFAAGAVCLAALSCAQLPVGPSRPVVSVRPAWLTGKIAGYESAPISNPPRSIHRAGWKGATVYYVPPVCCDIPSEVYDEKGALLCYASGGFAGGDGRCPGFSTEGMTLLWQDPRGPATPPR